MVKLQQITVILTAIYFIQILQQITSFKYYNKLLHTNTTTNYFILILQQITSL